MEFVILLIPVILIFIPFLIRNNYQQKLIKILDNQDYKFVDSNYISGIGTINNYYFMPFFPMGYHLAKINDFEKYVYIENYGKFIYLNVAFVSTFNSNYDFLIENSALFKEQGLQTGNINIDNNYKITGKNASKIVEILNNSLKSQEILMNFVENGVKLKIGIKENKLYVITYFQFMFFPSQLPEHKNAILLLNIINNA